MLWRHEKADFDRMLGDALAGARLAVESVFDGDAVGNVLGGNVRRRRHKEIEEGAGVQQNIWAVRAHAILPSLQPFDGSAMDWMQFVASLVESAAWPAVIIWVVWKLKDPIIARIPDLASVTLPGFNAEFGTKVEALAAAEVAAIEEAPAVVAHIEWTEAPDVVNAQGEVWNEDRFSEVDNDGGEEIDLLDLKSSPTGVVMEAWKALERTLFTAYHTMRKQGPTPTPTPTPKRIGRLQILKSLLRNGFLTEAELDVLLGTLKLRNMAAHSDKVIAPNNAIEFKRLAESLDEKYRERLELLKLNSPK